MGEDTAISWCDHTWSPWIGCAKVSPGCKHCYAETLDGRFFAGEHWGPKAPRRFMSDAYWAKPLRWAKAAKRDGVRRRIFPSQCDVFEDRRDLDEHRDRLWDLIDKTPELDWLLLTKRPDNVAAMIPWLDLAEGERDEDLGDLPGNVWLGVSVEDQEYADLRIPELKRLSYLFAKTFISYEPALGAIDWAKHLRPESAPDLVIFGDESGRSRRPSELAWARATRDACEDAGVSFHFKQSHLNDAAIGGDRDRAGKIHLPILDGKRHSEMPT